MTDVIEEPTHPIDKILALLRAHPTGLSLGELAVDTGYPPGVVLQYVTQARARGTTILAQPSSSKDGGFTIFWLAERRTP